MTDEADVADDVGASIRVPRQEAPRPVAQIGSVAAMPSVWRGLARRVRCASAHALLRREPWQGTGRRFVRS
jgi:hypothetical protein